MRWSSQIPTKFHVFRGTRDAARAFEVFEYGAITLSCQTFQTVTLTSPVPHYGPTTPQAN